jgi:hypothetical protein
MGEIQEHTSILMSYKYLIIALCDKIVMVLRKIMVRIRQHITVPAGYSSTNSDVRSISKQTFSAISSHFHEKGLRRRDS